MNKAIMDNDNNHSTLFVSNFDIQVYTNCNLYPILRHDNVVGVTFKVDASGGR